jgi:pimeloyl-ACP methyl ester carboxylesterase
VTRGAPVDGFQLEYDRTGSGAPVVALHGWPGDREDFAAVALPGADVVRPDLRGFGGSDKHLPGDYSATGQVASIVGLMDELGIERAVVAGYDVGSRVAQTIAREHPERVSAMVIAPPVPGAGRRVLEPEGQREFWYQQFHQLELVEQIVDGRPDAVRAYLRHFWSHWSGPAFTPTDAHLDRLAAAYGAPGAFTASIGWYRAGAGMVASSIAEQPPEQRITVPTTILWPEHDPLFPRAWSDRVDEWFADATVVPVDGVGHFVPVEAPAAFARAITERIT